MVRVEKPAEGSWTAHYPELGTKPVSFDDSNLRISRRPQHSPQLEAHHEVRTPHQLDHVNRPKARS